MAGKYEFRPDRQGSSLWKKLYMTPLQRARLFKWVLYGAVLVAASVIQDVVMSRFRVLDATTDLVPCAIFLICLAEGSETGGLFTLISAFAYLFSGTAPGFYCVPFLTILAILVTIFRQALLQKGFLASLLCTGAALLVYELLVFAIGLFLELTVFDRYLGFLLTTALTLIAIPILYPIVKSISTIGGEAWKD